MRIYCVDTLPHSYATGLGVTPEHLHAHIARSAELGFSHVLLAAPVASAFYAAPSQAGAPSTARERTALEQIASACLAQGLDLLLDLPPLAAQLQGYDQHAYEGHLAGWAHELAALGRLGVAGYRCLAPASLPASGWQHLLGAARGDAGRPLCFLAWTPGLSPAQLQALSPCGFDAVFTSLPWWDFHSPWLIEEHQRLRALGTRVIEPLADIQAGDAGTLPALREFGADAGAARRLLRCAALCGDGLLMPAGFEQGGAPGYDLGSDVSAANAWLSRHAATLVSPAPAALQIVSGTSAGLTLLARTVPAPGSDIDAPDAPGKAAASAAATESILIAINRSLARAAHYPAARILSALAPRSGAAGLVEMHGEVPDLETEAAAAHTSLGPADELRVPAGAVQVYRVAAALPVRALPAAAGSARTRAAAGRKSTAGSPAMLDAALHAPRIVIENLQPSCDAGRFAIRRVVGECVTVEADAWMDGHEVLGMTLCWRTAGATVWQEAPMQLLGNDRWRGSFALEQLGRYEYTVQAWHDAFGSWLSEVEKKRAAGQELHLEIEEGRQLVLRLIEGAAAVAGLPAKRVRQLSRLAEALAQPAYTALHRPGKGDRPPKTGTPAAPGPISIAGADEAAAPVANLDVKLLERHLQLLLDPATRTLLLASGVRPFATRHEPAYPVEAERLAARFGSWYELFPRSETRDAARHGSFDDVIARLPQISAMGFDVLYFPPIHPIGLSHRKGRNNTLNAQPGEPGSPYAIGSPDGGHDALHPQLGNFDDFQRLLAAASAHGMEIALDFAIQCSPDHPWLREHPEWFTHRPDGTVRYAENPPKKYQDIVNVDFYAEGTGTLWQALRDVVLFWAARGVRIFRVDNPHTKPLPFWEWLIAEVRALHPDAIFLAEAFTRPKPMARLAKLGFSQSYTYFTWRNDKRELSTYMTELTQTPLREYFRPHFFVNTPDINPYFLHRSGRPGFLIRAALATLLSGLWGMVSGFELCENEPLVVGEITKEEYLDSEKFEIRPRDWQRPGNIVAEITRLNALRRNYPALQHHLGVRFYYSSNEQVLYFARFNEPLPDSETALAESAGRGFGDSVLLVAINLDPYNTQQASIELPLWEWGLPDHATLQAEDLMQGYRFAWQGKVQQITLNPQQLPFAIWEVSPQPSPQAETPEGTQ